MSNFDDSYPDDTKKEPRLQPGIDQQFEVNEYEETIHFQAGGTAVNERDDDDRAQPVPEKIGRYEIKSVLGRGGFGAVYLAYDDALDRKVAIKVPLLQSTSQLQRDFLEEARQIARVAHPGIVTVFDVGLEDGVGYIVSDFLEGEDLNRWLKHHQPTWPECVKIVAAVGDALAAAHSRNVIHRDVKPANIIVTAHAEGISPVLVDFGLALSETTAAQRGELTGTPNYMSPEQARGEGNRLDGRTDIYSLGVILYRMLSGTLPFKADTLSELLQQIKHDDPRPPRQLNHNIPRELERICLKAMSRNIADRYTTAGDMAAELRRFLRQHESDAAAEAATVAAEAAPRSRQSMNILIADDHELTRFKLKTDLEKWGHEVTEASDGEEAWQLYQQSEYSIVITDWMMPRVDGLEFVRRIRGCEESEYVYVIMLTAKSEMHDIVAGMGAGADDFLTKPFHRDELQVRVRAGARITRLNRELNESNRRMRRSLEAAAQIQQSFLPTAKPEIAGFDFSWAHRPCVELGGDMLNFVRLDDGHLGLYVLDVSGEGVPAALMATTLSRLMSPPGNAHSLLADRDNGHSEPRILSPVEVAQKLNRLFAGESNSKSFFTLVYGILDCESKQFRFTSAGHPPVIHLRREAAPAMFDTAAFPIGLTAESNDFEEQQLELASGDRVLLYSDGLPDAMNPDGEVYGAARILESMSRRSRSSLDELTESLLQDLSTWRGRAEFTDDISVLSFEVA